MPAATAPKDAAFVIRDVLLRVAAWVPSRNRNISTSLTVSTLAHIALLLIVSSSLYNSGEDDVDLPELSVQIETHEGPNNDILTQAAAPAPEAETVESITDHVGSAEAPLQAEAPTPDVVQLDAAIAEAAADFSAQGALADVTDGALLTTSGDSDSSVAISAETVAVAVPLQAIQMPESERHMLSKNVVQLAQQMLDQETLETQTTWEIAGQQYTAKLTRQPAADSMGLEKVVAEIVTQTEGKRQKTLLSMKRLAFSHFTQLVDRWDAGVQLHDDIITGRFHSNTEIQVGFAGGVQPQFFGKVTTAAHSVTVNQLNMRTRGAKVFRGGVETRTEKVALPRAMPNILARAEADDAQRRRFTRDTRIVFNDDGSYAWRELRSDGPMQIEEYSSGTRYIFGAPGVKLHLRGTVKGGVVVYTDDDIVIEGSLVYENDPRTSPIARDFLTLISGKNVDVANRSITGPGDLHIHATIYARRSFNVSETFQGRPATMYILGSVTAGTISETEPRYATKIEFDARFENMRPPEFPMTRRYEVEQWDGNWQAE